MVRQAVLAQAGSALGGGAEQTVVVVGFHCQGPVVSGRRLTWRWFEGALVTSLLVVGISGVKCSWCLQCVVLELLPAAEAWEEWEKN